MLNNVFNVTRRYKIRNTMIREMVGTTPVHHFIQQQRTRWFGHVVRMPPHQLPNRAYNKRILGYNSRGRPRKTSVDGVKETLTSHGISPIRAPRLAVNRQLFHPTTPPSGRIKQSSKAKQRQPIAKQRLSEPVKRSASGLYVFNSIQFKNQFSIQFYWWRPCQYWQYAIVMQMQKFIHIHNVPRKYVDINLCRCQSKTGRQPVLEQSPTVWRLIKDQENLLPTSLVGKTFSMRLQKCPADENYNNQWQPFADFKKHFYNLWQPIAQQRFWEVGERSATCLYLWMTGALGKNWKWTFIFKWNIFELFFHTIQILTCPSNKTSQFYVSSIQDSNTI